MKTSSELSLLLPTHHRHLFQEPAEADSRSSEKFPAPDGALPIVEGFRCGVSNVESWCIPMLFCKSRKPNTMNEVFERSSWLWKEYGLFQLWFQVSSTWFTYSFGAFLTCVFHYVRVVGQLVERPWKVCQSMHFPKQLGRESWATRWHPHIPGQRWRCC